MNTARLDFSSDGTIAMSKNPLRHHTPDDDPEAGTPGTGEDVCPDCHGTGKQVDLKTGQPTQEPCERCDGTGRIIEGIG
jgi:DnaJ-class molecular chaperone